MSLIMVSSFSMSSWSKRSAGGQTRLTTRLLLVNLAAKDVQLFEGLPAPSSLSHHHQQLLPPPPLVLLLVLSPFSSFSLSSSFLLHHHILVPSTSSYLSARMSFAAFSFSPLPVFFSLDFSASSSFASLLSFPASPMSFLLSLIAAS